jgi:hypothetical protein
VRVFEERSLGKLNVSEKEKVPADFDKLMLRALNTK